MTLSIPEELARRMKLFKEIRWSEVARRAIEGRVEDLESIEKISSKSRLTIKDAEEISRKIKKSAFKRLMEKNG